MARVPLVAPEDVDAAYRDHLVQEGVRPNLWAAIGNNPRVMAAYDEFIEHLYEVCGLGETEQELVILAVAAELSSRYLWHHHVNLARDRGVTDAQIRGIGHFDAAPFSTGEEALIRFARAVARGQVTDSDHTAITDEYEVGTVVGVAVLAGTYLSVARVTTALGVDLEADAEFVGWDPK